MDYDVNLRNKGPNPKIVEESGLKEVTIEKSVIFLYLQACFAALLKRVDELSMVHEGHLLTQTIIPRDTQTTTSYT